MATVHHEKKIKSADRVLDILEMFNEGRNSVTVMDVARALNVPQSSTSELLGSLVRRGYLTRKRGERVFRPTSRVALLGAWVHPKLYRNGHLLSMMDQLREETGLSVALCSLVGVGVKHIHTVGDLPEEISCGAERHLLHSPFGHVILSTIYRETVRLMVHRLNAESAADDQVRFCDLNKKLTEVSRFRVAVGQVADGWSGIAVLLPQGMGEEQLSVGIVAPTAEIEARQSELLRILRQAIARHLVPRIASDTRLAKVPETRQMAFS
jgi:DNA-binding IclR family transcriptional regulator